ncbi:PREDICTED: trihelix transcription factor GT-2-like [Lupinus angustifolius]|uniref:trihelix transcription factor GT-2-like n=1 Tax=Lupinus angustifolius TaxID=3871 RepID=UPI00092E8D13|nr:PREDICTED: trihelix transcription factor GT-2-like [Lupinus angustifolius]
MSDPYGLPEDLRRLISSSRTTHFNTTTHLHQPPPPLPPPPYDPNIMVGDVFFPPRSSFTHFNHYHHHHHNHDFYNSSSTLNHTSTNTNTISATPTVAATASDYAAAAATAPFCSVENNTAAEKGWLGFDPGNNRWPRQETLSLLEIRSRLDSKFRENNLKAPLWNEISRIMAEEFGYQRSGKKCKEKFENLYKYYKKTKEGKGSRQDGKHYRFFRQLEAICGEPTNIHHNASTSDNKTHHHDASNTRAGFQSPTFATNQDSVNVDHFPNHMSSESLSFSNLSDQLETSSSENNDEDLSAIAYMMNQSRDNSNKHKGLELEHRQSEGRVRKSWRGKIEEIVGSHTRKIIETQDAWMEKMLSVVERREQEMASKEEERKRKESMRFDQEVHELWAKERAWVEARDAALIKVVRKHFGFKELEAFPLHHEAMVVEEEQQNKNNEYPCETASGKWTEIEISNLIQLKNSFEERLRENGCLVHNGLWDEISAKLGCLGFDRSASECKQIWDEISISLRVTTVECSSSSANTTRPWYLGLKLRDDDEL